MYEAIYLPGEALDYLNHLVFVDQERGRRTFVDNWRQDTFREANSWTGSTTFCWRTGGSEGGLGGEGAGEGVVLSGENLGDWVCQGWPGGARNWGGSGSVSSCFPESMAKGSSAGFT